MSPKGRARRAQGAKGFTAVPGKVMEQLIPDTIPSHTKGEKSSARIQQGEVMSALGNLSDNTCSSLIGEGSAQDVHHGASSRP